RRGGRPAHRPCQRLRVKGAGVLILNQSRNVQRPLAAFADIVITGPSRAARPRPGAARLIVHAVKGGRKSVRVFVTSGAGPDDDMPLSRVLDYERVVRPDD